MGFVETIAVVAASPVADLRCLASLSRLNRDSKQCVTQLFESRGLQQAELLEAMRLYNSQLKAKKDTLPAAYLLLHAKEEMRSRILSRFSLPRLQAFLGYGEIKAITTQAFAGLATTAATKAYKLALDRCHVSCFTPVGIFYMVYEISKVLDHLSGNRDVDISLWDKLVEERASLVIVNSPTIQGLLTDTASVRMTLFPRAWLEDVPHDSGYILRSIPRWFIEDPRLAYLFALDKFQTELDNLIDELKPPTGKITNFATTDLCFSILSSPIGLALYRDTDHINLYELYALGQQAGALPSIRRLVYSFPGVILVKTAGPQLFADIVLHSPTGLAAFLAAADFPIAAKGLAHVMRFRRDRDPMIEHFKIHPRFVRALISAADKLTQLDEEHLVAACSRLGVWSSGSTTTHSWLPHDLIVDALLVDATHSSESVESQGASRIRELLRALDTRRPVALDDRGARAVMGMMLLQDPACEGLNSTVSFVANASIVASALVAFVAEDKAAAISSVSKDAKTFIFKVSTEHADKIAELLAARDGLLSKVVLHTVDPATGAANFNAPGISVADLLRIVSSPEGRRLQNDGVLDVSNPQQIMEVSTFLANPVTAQGLAEKVWDADFLVKLRISPTPALLDGLKKDLMPKADVLALPRTVFGTFDALHDAITEGFMVTEGDSYDNMLAQLARYKEDEMTEEQIARAREKSGENETIVKLKLLFSHYEYEDVEGAVAWEQLSKLGMTYDDCATMPLPCFLLLLDEDVYALLERDDSKIFSHIASLPVSFAQQLVSDPEARQLILRPWFPLDRCASWSRAQVESAIHLSNPSYMSFVERLVPSLASFEELVSLPVTTLKELRKKGNVPLITSGSVKVSELVSVGSNADAHLKDFLAVCFQSGLIKRAVEANDWANLLQQLRDQDVQALLRRDMELFETQLLYVVGDWKAEDLPYLARLKDSDVATCQTTLQLLSKGHLDRESFRDIVTISPSWLGPGSEGMYQMGVLNAKVIRGLHAKAPQLSSIVGYLNFRGIAVTYNNLLGTSNEGDDVSFELFLNDDFSPEIIQHLLLGRYAVPLEVDFLSYDYFVHPDKTPLEATGRLLAKTRPAKDQVLIQGLVKRGIRAGHIRDYNGQDSLEDVLPTWQAMAASDPDGANFLKSAEQLAAAKKAAEKAAAAKPASTTDAENPFLAMMKAAEQKATTGTSDSSAAAKPTAPAAGAPSGTTFAAPAAAAAGSKFTFQMPAAGAAAPGAKFTFKPQATSNVDLAAAAQRRRQARAAKDL